MAGPPPSSPSLVRVYRLLSSGHLGPPAGTLRGGPPTMRTRDVALVSTSVVVGALASAFAVRFLSGYWAKSSSDEIDSLAVDTDRPLENSSVQSPFDPSKRKGYLSWDDYFMALAFLSAKRSKDPNRQSGIGYNGFPRGCSDDKLSWAKKSKSGNPLETKYPYVCHAEVNAILNTNHASAAGQRLYVTMFPCNECAKIIIQSGVSEVIYFVEKRLNDSVMYTASHVLLSMAGVKVRKHQPQMSQILIKFEEP